MPTMRCFAVGGAVGLDGGTTTGGAARAGAGRGRYGSGALPRWAFATPAASITAMIGQAVREIIIQSLGPSARRPRDLWSSGFVDVGDELFHQAVDHEVSVGDLVLAVPPPGLNLIILLLVLRNHG